MWIARIKTWWKCRRIRVLVAGMSLLPCALLAFLYTPASVPAFAQVKTAYVPSDAYLLDRNGAVIDTVRIDMQVRRLQWTALHDISPALVEAVIASEDHRFWQHHGVDWYSMAGATRDILLAKQRRGASTITMQLAALIEHWGHTASGFRAIEHKLLQMRLALTLERHWSKQQILEAYLNLVTFRGELQGVAAMAQVMAGKTAAGLSLPESMVIAALLPAPNASSHQVARRACQRSQSRHVAVSCDQLRQAASILLEDKEPLSSSEEIAPHVARQLLTQPGQVVQSTLDAGIQKMVQQSLAVHLAAIAGHNVRDGAVLVVDNDSGDVLAYVGSGGPYSQSPSVDGVSARRQAGSTLKPFLYELAFEKKYLTAASLLNDSPLNLETAGGTYIPQDYDHEYKGLVSTRTALGSSLNVPAVRTLILTGVEAFRDRLHQLGYAGITEDGDYYGYSLALGSAEVSVWEQAQAYRTLARLGKWSPIHLQRTEDSAPARDLLSPQASFIVSDIMSDRLARVVTFGLSNHLNTSFWSAAKTGTSKDMRDNWCVGFSQKYTVAVWVGNFEGDPMQDVSGITGAAPVWQDVMLALHEHDPSRAPAPPAGVTSVMTAFSPAVETPRHEWFIDGTLLHKVTAVAPSHQMVHIDSPANGMVIALDPDIPPDDQRVPLTVKGASTGMQLKLNNKVIGSAAQQILWTPERGSYYLSVEDVRHHVLDRILFRVR